MGDINHILTWNGDNLALQVQWVPVRSSSDIWSFRLHGQFLVGPERNGISYNKISRIYGLDSGYLVNFRGHWGRFTRLWMPLETVDAVGAGLTVMRAFRWPKFEQNPSTFGWDLTQSSFRVFTMKLVASKALSVEAVGCMTRIYGHSGYMVNFSWSRRWRSNRDPLYDLISAKYFILFLYIVPCVRDW